MLLIRCPYCEEERPELEFRNAGEAHVARPADPATYDGGALRLLGRDGEASVRPAAGSAVLYVTGQLHEVTPVTGGMRLACVGWVQSQVRRADQRDLLFELERARDDLPEGDPRLRLDNAIGNLLRMWGEG